MNITPLPPLQTTTDIDPLVSLRLDVSAVAELALGGLSDASMVAPGGRPLALLPFDELELDLSRPEQRQFGAYELLELIGEGGMGVVYRARQIELDREVAVKLLAAGPWASRTFIERFRREAQNAARMQHPNIVTVYEVGDFEELHFFSMRLVKGGSLAALLKREGRLPPRHAAQLLRTIAEAVDYAHCLDVLHLDLKPANVLIDESGVPHVADFGLARRIEHGFAADSNEISGTPSYMAPEQAMLGAQKLTRATDIWGLGAILYELVTGEPPFLDRSPQATLKRVVEGGLRDPRELAPQLPDDLVSIIRKCMSFSANERYCSARDLADDLARFLEGREVRARPLNFTQRLMRFARREPRLAAVSVLALAVLLTGITATTTQWLRAESNAARRQVALWNQRRSAIEKLFEQNQAFVALPQIVANLAEEDAAGARQRADADRSRIGAVMANAPQLLDTLHTRSGEAVALSSDGTLAVVTGLSDDGTKAVTQLIELTSRRVLWATTHPDLLREIAFSNDGKRVIGMPVPASTTIRPDGRHMIVFDVADGHLLPLAGAKPSQATDGIAEIEDQTCDAEGRFVVVHAANLQSRLYRIADGQALGPSFRTTAYGRILRSGFLLGAKASYLASSENGFSLLRLIDPRTGEERYRHRFDPPLSAWRASPDPRWLALAQEDGAVWLLDTETLTLHALPNTPVGRVWMLRYSANGDWLAAGASDGSARVWDTVSRSPIVAPIHTTEDKLLGVLPEPEAGLLITVNSGSNSLRMWRLPSLPRPDANIRAREFPSQLAHGSVVARGAVAFARESQTFASISVDGELRIWHMPPTPVLHSLAPPQQSDALYFDGEHIVAVGANEVQMKSALSGESLGASIHLDQPVGFAVLSADSTALLTSHGRALNLWDWQRGTRLMPTVMLTNTPRMLALAKDTSYAAVSWSDSRAGKAAESIELVDLRKGSIVARTTNQDGILFGLRFDGDTNDLLAWSFSRLYVYSPGTLAVHYPPVVRGDPPGRIVDAVGSRQAGGIFVSFAHDDGNKRELCLFDRESGSFAKCEHQLRAGEISAAAARVYTHDDVRDHSLQSLFSLPATNPAEWTHGPVVARADSAMIAIGTRSGVLVVDGHDGHPIAPELAVPLDTVDAVSQIAWGPPESAAILARTERGRWLHWRLPSAAQRVEEIRDQGAALGVNNVPNWGGNTSGSSNVTAPNQDTSDPARTPPLLATVRVTSTARTGNEQILPRARDTDARLLDLTPFYTTSLGGWRPVDDFDADSSAFAEMPQGVIRIQGIDYDLRGQIALCRPDWACSASLPHAVRGIPATLPHPQAAHLLLTGANWILRDWPDGYVRFHYTDGSNERAALLRGHDLGGFWGGCIPDDSHTQPVWWFGGTSGDTYNSLVTTCIYHARIANPHPERVLASLDFEVSHYFSSAFSIFAATLEDGDATPGKELDHAAD